MVLLSNIIVKLKLKHSFDLRPNFQAKKIPWPIFMVKKAVPADSSDSKHKAVFNLSGINASVGSSDTQLPRTKADYRAGAGGLAERSVAASSARLGCSERCAYGIFERLVRNSSFTLFTQGDSTAKPFPLIEIHVV